jgi:hypothetical protein
VEPNQTRPPEPPLNFNSGRDNPAAVLLVSFTKEMVGAFASLKSALEHVQRSGPIELTMVAFITSEIGRLALLVVAFVLVQQAGRGARGGSTLPSFTLLGVRRGWSTVRQWLRPNR